MTEQRRSTSRRRQQGFQKHLRENLWLLIPLGVLGLVVVLGLTRGRQQQAEQMEPTEAAGLVEDFAVTTPGSPLPAQPADVELPGTQFPDLGQEHVPETERVQYNSNPPTSGPHYAQPAAWGVYTEAPLDEQLVHNLEHGGIIISYDPAQVQEAELQQIREQARELSEINPRVVVTPRTEMDAAIALTAWGYLQKLESYDPDAVRTFYDAHIGRGPECRSGQCPG